MQTENIKQEAHYLLEKGMDGYITAYCPALKGCVTQGKTEEEATQNLKEAIGLYLETDPEEGKQLSSIVEILRHERRNHYA